MTARAELISAAAAAACAVVLTSGDSGSARLARILPAPRAAAPPSAGGTARTASAAGSRGGQGPALTTPRRRHAASSSASWRRAGAVTLAGAGLAALLGGVVGVVLGVGVGALGYVVLGRLEPHSERQRREQARRDLPAAASLLSVAVRAGATPVAAIEIVAAAVGGPLGEDLQRLAASARLGGDFTAGCAISGADAGAAPLARALARSIDSGAPLAAALDRLAADLHAERRFEVDRRARSVGVRAAAPLGLCFLPGFLLVGVVPVVAGIASTVLGFAL